MRRFIPWAPLVLALLMSSGLIAAQEFVTANQGAPGSFGPWPVSLTGTGNSITVTQGTVTIDGGIVAIDPGYNGAVLGTLISWDGGSVDAGSGSTPFGTLAAQAGGYVDIQCDVAACVGFASVCSCSNGNAAWFPTLQAKTTRRFRVPSTTPNVCAVPVAVGAMNCGISPVTF